METVKLRNGVKEALPLVTVTMMQLRSLINKKPIVFYELVMKARNSQHKFFGNCGQDLEDLRLVTNGHIHDSVRNIILSATEGDGLDMSLRSPVEDSAEADEGDVPGEGNMGQWK